MKLRKFVVAVVLIGALSLTTAGSALAESDDMGMDACPHEATIETLHMCVAHAAAQGHIDNVGVARSLHAKLYAAGAALERGNAGTAANILGAFIQELNAQAGKHFDAPAAEHLAMHAEMVIAAVLIS